MSQNNSGKLMPNLDQNSTKMLNLTVLQRIDPFIEEILITAAHVTFYEFNIDTTQWSRKDVEGSLFVVKRNAQPRFQFIVMNRRNTDNLVENLLGDFEYEVQLPYLLYRNASQEVNGIWFYNPRECEDVANLFSRILNAYSKVPSKSMVPAGKSEFEELEAVPNMAVIEGPLEPSKSTVTSATVTEESGFLNFFSAAMNIGNDASIMTYSGQHSNTAYSGQHPSTASAVHFPTHVPSVAPSAPTAQVAMLPRSGSSSSVLLHETPGLLNSGSSVQNLVKPSSFFTPPSSLSPLIMPSIASSAQHAPAQNPALNPQRSYGAPLLQPFPPPTPPPSLTPTAPPQDGSFMSREKVRNALLMLVQDDQFIDLFHHALLKVQNS